MQLSICINVTAAFQNILIDCKRISKNIWWRLGTAGSRNIWIMFEWKLTVTGNEEKCCCWPEIWMKYVNGSCWASNRLSQISPKPTNNPALSAPAQLAMVCVIVSSPPIILMDRVNSQRHQPDHLSYQMWHYDQLWLSALKNSKFHIIS